MAQKLGRKLLDFLNHMYEYRTCIPAWEHKKKENDRKRVGLSRFYALQKKNAPLSLRPIGMQYAPEYVTNIFTCFQFGVFHTIVHLVA